MCTCSTIRPHTHYPAPDKRVQVIFLQIYVADEASMLKSANRLIRYANDAKLFGIP